MYQNNTAKHYNIEAAFTWSLAKYFYRSSRDIYRSGVNYQIALKQLNKSESYLEIHQSLLTKYNLQVHQQIDSIYITISQ